MSELAKIRGLLDKKFNELKEELQNNCSHEEISDWMEVHWAPGHSTGKIVKNCKRCGKEMAQTSGAVRYENLGTNKPEMKVVFYDEEEDLKDDI